MYTRESERIYAINYFPAYTELLRNIRMKIMAKLTLIDRACIIVLTEQGVSQSQVAAQVGCSHTCVRNLLLKYEKTGTVEDQPKCGCPKKLTDRAKTTILHLCKKDRFCPATSITDELNVNYGISVSVSTVKRTLADFGMHGRIARRKPFLSAANRKKHLPQAQRKQFKGGQAKANNTGGHFSA